MIFYNSFSLNSYNERTISLYSLIRKEYDNGPYHCSEYRNFTRSARTKHSKLWRNCVALQYFHEMKLGENLVFYAENISGFSHCTGIYAPDKTCTLVCFTFILPKFKSSWHSLILTKSSGSYFMENLVFCFCSFVGEFKWFQK